MTHLLSWNVGESEATEVIEEIDLSLSGEVSWLVALLMHSP